MLSHVTTQSYASDNMVSEMRGHLRMHWSLFNSSLPMCPIESRKVSLTYTLVRCKTSPFILCYSNRKEADSTCALKPKKNLQWCHTYGMETKDTTTQADLLIYFWGQSLHFKFGTNGVAQWPKLKLHENAHTWNL